MKSEISITPHTTLFVLACVLFFPASFARGQQSSIGINLTDDWLWADAIRQARPHWDTAAHLGDGAAKEDSDHWPVEDCSLMVWEGHAHNDGTYKLSFTGKAMVSVSYGYGRVNGQASSTGSYNPQTNTTAATVVITDTGAENCSLIFTDTQRTALSATNTGISNVHLYRPLFDGAATSHPPSTLFTQQTLDLASHFSVIRFMDLLGANNSHFSKWSDRALPSKWNQSPMAYEYAVAYGNAAGRDIYLNLPLRAMPDYFANLAYLVKYGSDGIHPYTSPQAHPIYPPLKQGLHVYLEYSNEVWNGGFDQEHQNYDIVAADKAANNAEWAILNFDGAGKENFYACVWRRIIYQAKRISDAFRGVYGDAAMPPNDDAIVRPLIEFQGNNGQDTGGIQLAFLDAYFNNADGAVHVPTPHPVNYFFWGAGGATYYNANNDKAATVDGLFASGVPGSTYPAAVQADSALAKGYGLKRIAYEGGWGVYNGTCGFMSAPGTAAALAKFDPRATTAQVTGHNIFQQSGGDLEIFYNSSCWAPAYIWSLTDKVFDLQTPLFRAVTAIEGSHPPAITYGNTISSGTSTTLTWNKRLFSHDSWNPGVSDDAVIGFVPLITTAGDYQINLLVNAAGPGRYMRVLLDNQTLGGQTVSVPVSESPVSVSLGTVTVTAGQHGLRIMGQYNSNNSYDGNSGEFGGITFTPIQKSAQ